jgi:hypothetical protein
VPRPERLDLPHWLVSSVSVAAVVPERSEAISGAPAQFAVYHIDPKTGRERDLEETRHTEILTGAVAAAAYRLHQAAEDAAELGFGVLLDVSKRLIVHCFPGA